MIIRQRSLSARRRSGFTLLEILVVVAIILVLASVATVAYMTILSENKEDTARIAAASLEQSVKTYIIKHPDQDAPQTLQECIKYIEGAQDDPTKLNDPWGQPFQLRYDDTGRPVVYTTHAGVEISSDKKLVRQ